MSEAKKQQTEEFVTAERRDYRKNWPAWAKQLPKFRFNQPNKTFRLIDTDRLIASLKERGASPEAIQRIKDDIDFLDHELERLFRQRDYRASLQQNRYRLYQVGFTLLAALAGVLGAIQALTVNTAPDIMPYIAFGETVVALFTTYLATISGRVPALPEWINNRRHAEYLRREYYRFLMDLEPYDTVSGYERKQLLSIRAANINRGVYPDKSADI
ncbi:MAG: DUF4231 domain-containing protein [Chloroflexota bacterium]